MSSGFPQCARTLAAVTVIGLAFAACSSDLGTTAPSGTGVGSARATASTADATTAATVCGLLRSFDNDAADIANAAALAVRNDDDPTARVDDVLAGFDGLLARVELHATAISTLDRAALSGGAALVADLAQGAVEARAELVDERAEFALLPSVEDGDMTGRVGQFFNALEKTMSVIEPVLVDYASDVTVAAFAAEPTCRFVIQT